MSGTLRMRNLSKKTPQPFEGRWTQSGYYKHVSDINVPVYGSVSLNTARFFEVESGSRAEQYSTPPMSSKSELRVTPRGHRALISRQAQMYAPALY